MMRSRRSTMKVLSGGVRIVSHRCSDDAVPFDIPQVGTKSLKHGPSLLWRYRPERIASSRFARSCSFRSNADTRLQRDPSGSLHNTDTGRDRASDETASSVRSSPQRSSTTMSLPLLPWCGVRADRRSPMRIDSRLRRAVQFRSGRRPTTNFTRPRTRSSNPVPKESCELRYGRRRPIDGCWVLDMVHQRREAVAKRI